MQQLPIDEDAIRAMLASKPRRMRLSTEWLNPTHPSQGVGKDPSLVLPFSETFKNAFSQMCVVPCTGLRVGVGGRCYTHLKAPLDSAAMKPLHNWLEKVGKYVAIRDRLAVSFALDYDRVDGNPNKPQTEIGKLRARAKPYDQPVKKSHRTAADELANCCVEALADLTCFEVADAIVAMPPSRPDKDFDLPEHMAKVMAEELGIDDLTAEVETIRPRDQLKNLAASDKLGAIRGTVAASKQVSGHTIVLLDDLYQSGTSMNYVAMKLLEAGADAVLGLACEKTCRNDDNT